jgi:DNA-binding response OmpR family regulator
MFDIAKKTELDGHRPGVRRSGRGAQGGRTATRLDSLDIGIPTLNGIEAARRIHKLAPDSKIVFLSMEDSAEVVQEALSLWGLGYVVKAHAESQLLAVVQAVRQGRRFLSCDDPGHNFADTRLGVFAVNEQLLEKGLGGRPCFIKQEPEPPRR